MKTLLTNSAGICALALAAALAGPVAAQDVGAPANTPQAADTTTLGEVVVTARRREESLQDVPVSVAAIGAQQIENQGAQTVTDLQYTTPNVYFGNPGQAATGVFIRGVGDFSRNIGIDTRVSVYIDGVDVGSSIAIDQGLIDIERVEVLRGPQGTLFGKNTVAGAVNIVTRKPGQVFGASIDAAAGNYDSRRVAASVNLPLSETLAVRAGVQYQLRDGYVNNIFNGEDLQNVDKLTGRLQVRWTPSDALTIDVAGDFMRDRHTNYYKPLIDPPFSPGGLTDAPGPREVNVNTRFDHNVDVRGISATADYRLDNGGRIVAIGSHRYSRLVNADDQDNGPFLAADSHFRTRYEQTTGEFRYESPAEGRLTYVAGAYIVSGGGDVNIDAASDFFPTTINGTDNLLLHNEGTSDSESYALFGDATYALTDRLTFELGARGIREKKSIDYEQQTSVFATLALAVPPYQITDSFWTSAFTPSMSLSYKASEDLLFYGRLSRGYKSGGYNADVVANDDIQFDPEYVTAGEVGFKGDFLDHRLRFNAAAFISQHTDYQVFQFTIQGASTIIQLRNAGEAESKGVEAELIAEPVPGLRLTAAGGYTDATFTEFDDCAGIGASCAGQQLIGAPELTGSFSAQLTRDVGSLGEANLFVQYAYRDKVFTNVPNTASNQTDDIGLVNASASFAPAGHDVEIYANVTNLFDELKVENANFNFLQIPQVFYTPPRFWEVGVRVRF